MLQGMGGVEVGVRGQKMVWVGFVQLSKTGPLFGKLFCVRFFFKEIQYLREFLKMGSTFGQIDKVT